MAVAGAIVGVAIGGWSNGRFRRKLSLMVADFLFLVGSVIMTAAPAANVLIISRVFVGLVVGMASMTTPLYISEASPARIRGALVSTNGFLITRGQFLSYLINLAFTKVPGTWRWMPGIAGVPAILQFCLMFFLPESPRWLYRKGKEEEAKATLRKIYQANEVEAEIHALHESVENEAKEKGNSEKISIGKLLKTKTVRRSLLKGVGLQVFQQFLGINTMMYYSPTIVQLAGFASNQTSLALSLITSGLNASGSIVSIYFIDRTGRKKLMVISLVGVAISLAVLIQQTSTHSPATSSVETAKLDHFSFPSYKPNSVWDCTICLRASSPECGFCASKSNKLLPGVCWVGIKLNSERLKSSRRPIMVHVWLFERIWLACSDRPSNVHRILLSGHGSRTMDRELQDLPLKVPWNLRWDCRHIKLDIESHRHPIISISYRNHRNFVDIFK